MDAGVTFKAATDKLAERQTEEIRVATMRPAHAVFWKPGMVAPPPKPKVHPDSARERLLGTVPDPIMAAASKPFVSVRTTDYFQYSKKRKSR